jgi:hypothetical protein
LFASLLFLAETASVQTISADEVDEGERDESQYYHVGDQTIRISTPHTKEKVSALIVVVVLVLNAVVPHKCVSLLLRSSSESM